MLKLLVVVSSLVLSTNVAHARNIKKHVPEQSVDIMTYAQLMSLTPAKRVAYINDVREVLVTLEEMEMKAQKASYRGADASLLHDKIAQILNLLSVVPEAKAGIDDAGDAPPLVVLPVYKVRTDSDGKIQSRGWMCVSSGASSDSYDFSTDVGTCVRHGSSINRSATGAGDGTGSYYYHKGPDAEGDSSTPRVMAVPRTSCKTGESPVYVNTGGDAPVTSYCAADTALQKMNPTRKAEVQSTEAPPASVKGKFSGLSAGRLSSDSAGTAPSTGADVAIGGAKARIEQGSLLDGNPRPSLRDLGVPSNEIDKMAQQAAEGAPTAPAVTDGPSGGGAQQDRPTAPAAPPVADGKKKVQTIKVTPDQQPTETLKGDKAAEYADKFKPPVKNQDRPPMDKDPKKEPAALPEQQQKPPEKITAKKDCEPMKEADVEKIRSQLTAVDHKIACINAGNFTQYNSETAEAGSCQPVRKTSLPNVQYTGTNGKAIKGDKGCPASMQLCSPAIFCDTTDANKIKVYCIPGGGSDSHKNNPYTSTCSRASAGKPCDIEKMSGPTHDAWDGMRKDYKKNFDAFCVNGSDGFKQFFCSECQKIKERLDKWKGATPAVPAPVQVQPGARPEGPKPNSYVPMQGLPGMPAGNFTDPTTVH